MSGIVLQYSVYIGCGNHEPWGMRLNDVLQCGAPLIVNQGMGGSLLVERYGCGMTFPQNDASELARRLAVLIDDKEKYLEIADKAFNAASAINPEVIAKKIAVQIKRTSDW